MTSTGKVSSAVTFGDLLKQLRKRSGLTQAELAAAVGYSVPFISNLELNQRQPDVGVVVQRFVPALGLQEDPKVAARLVELAASARGERLPARFGLQEEMRLPALPAMPTSLIGRDQEVESICNILMTHSGRLLTMTGPPGIGKTRLALAVMERVQAVYTDGGYFVPLAALQEKDLVVPAINTELGIGEVAGRTPQARLVDFLRYKELLLVLDNFEQITAAAQLVAELLAACPRLHMLVTSRERLHLRAEQRYRVPPLEPAAAVALFIQRAQTVESDFALTPENEPLLVQICQHLDCLPLAIELCAARIDLFTPQALLAELLDRRLDLLTDGPLDLPARQRTLRNAIHRSYALLDGKGQALFRCLGVFAGGFELGVLEHFGFDKMTLSSLVHKSLVQASTQPNGVRRFLLLETLSEYAREELIAQGEAVAVHRLHAVIFLQLAEEAARHFRSSDEGMWLERLTVEQANLRAALTFTLQESDSNTFVRLVIALWRFWLIRGHYAEGQQWLEKSLSCASENGQRAALLYACGMLARRRGDVLAAGEHFVASLVLYRKVDDLRGIASALRGLGFIRYFQNDYAEARRLLEEALALFQQLDDSEGIAVTLNNLAYIVQDPDEEQRLYQQSLALRRRSGNLRGIKMSLAGLAFHAIGQGNYQEARQYVQEHQKISTELGDQSGIAASHSILGRIALLEGNQAETRRYYEQAVELGRQNGDYLSLPEALLDLATSILLCGEYAGVLTFCQQALVMFQEQGKVFSMLKVLADVAGLEVMRGELEQGLCLAGAVTALCEDLNVHLRKPELTLLEQARMSARQGLDAEKSEMFWAVGRAMTMEQVVAYALAIRADE